VSWPKVLCLSEHFEHVQRQRRGLAFARRPKERAMEGGVSTLHGLLQRYEWIECTPRARCGKAAFA